MMSKCNMKLAFHFLASRLSWLSTHVSVCAAWHWRLRVILFLLFSFFSFASSSSSFFFLALNLLSICMFWELVCHSLASWMSPCNQVSMFQEGAFISFRFCWRLWHPSTIPACLPIDCLYGEHGSAARDGLLQSICGEREKRSVCLAMSDKRLSTHNHTRLQDHGFGHRQRGCPHSDQVQVWKPKSATIIKVYAAKRRNKMHQSDRYLEKEQNLSIRSIFLFLLSKNCNLRSPKEWGRLSHSLSLSLFTINQVSERGRDGEKKGIIRVSNAGDQGIRCRIRQGISKISIFGHRFCQIYQHTHTHTLVTSFFSPLNSVICPRITKRKGGVAPWSPWEDDEEKR